MTLSANNHTSVTLSSIHFKLAGGPSSRFGGNAPVSPTILVDMITVGSATQRVEESASRRRESTKASSLASQIALCSSGVFKDEIAKAGGSTEVTSSALRPPGRSGKRAPVSGGSGGASVKKSTVAQAPNPLPPLRNEFGKRGLDSEEEEEVVPGTTERPQKATSKRTKMVLPEDSAREDVKSSTDSSTLDVATGSDATHPEPEPEVQTASTPPSTPSTTVAVSEQAVAVQAPSPDSSQPSKGLKRRLEDETESQSGQRVPEPSKRTRL